MYSLCGEEAGHLRRRGIKVLFLNRIKKELHFVFAVPFCLLSSESKYFHHQEGYRYAKDGGQKVTHHWWKIQPVVKYQDDNVLNDVVWYIGYKEFDISAQRQLFVENNETVHPVGDNIAHDIADVEIEIIVRGQIGAEPGNKGAIKGIDTAYHQK